MHELRNTIEKEFRNAEKHNMLFPYGALLCWFEAGDNSKHKHGQAAIKPRVAYRTHTQQQRWR